MKFVKLLLAAIGIVAILYGVALVDTGSAAQSAAQPNRGYSAILDNGTVGSLKAWQAGGDYELEETGGLMKVAGTVIIIAGAVMVLSALCIREKKV